MLWGNVFTKHTYLQVSHWPIGKKNHGFSNDGDQCDDSTYIPILSLAGALFPPTAANLKSLSQKSSTVQYRIQYMYMYVERFRFANLEQ